MPVLMEAVLNSVYQGQQCVNRWNYLGNGTPAGISWSNALMRAMGGLYDDVFGYPTDSLLEAIRWVSVGAVTFETLTTRDVYSVTDFYDLPFVPPMTGNAGANGLSPTEATGFRTNRVRSDIRRGTKRFVGVAEEAVTAGGLLNIADGSRIDDLRIALSAVLEYNDDGNDLTFTPMVVSKEKYETPESTLARPRFAYKYYGTYAEQMEHAAVGVAWQPYTHTRTQVSRQYGRGR